MPRDDRIIDATLTSKKKEAAKFTDKVIKQIKTEIRSKLTPQKLTTLANPLIRIRNNLGGFDPSIE